MIQQKVQRKAQTLLPHSVSYSDNIHSQDYVTQFLDFTYCNDNQCMSQDFNKTASPLNNKDHKVTYQQLSNQSPEKSKQIQKIRSSFHNFQKHLVTTLRHSIDIIGVQFDSETKQIQHLLWNFFMKSLKATRTLIYLVYGGFYIQSAKQRKFNKQYGLQRLIKNYPLHLVRKAQHNLRLQTLRQISKINFDWQLQNRRMKNKQQFKIYFEAFIEELKDGGFNKRIPKDKKIKAQNELSKKQQAQNLFSQQP